MIRKTFLRLFTTLCFFVLAASFSAATRATLAQVCPPPTAEDERIVKEINDALKASDLADQMQHINIYVCNRAAILVGWTDTKDDYDDLYDIVYDARPRVINVNKFHETPPPLDSPERQQGGGCLNGVTKPCGDICIPVGDACNIGPKPPLMKPKGAK